MLTAERMYAERGVNGVSLREIGAAAGQLNTGAARYHFGSKIGLINAVFEQRMVPINALRCEMIDALIADGETRSVRRLAEAFVHPLASALGDRGNPTWYVRFAVTAGDCEGAAPTRAAQQEWTSGFDHLQHLMIDALTDLPAPLREQRWRLFNSFVAHSLADREALLELPEPPNWFSRELFLSTVVDAAVALITAPVSVATALMLEGAHR